ncbi:hypothetical protein KDM87_12080 [Undibacterium sp. FT147W]|uniref:Uncharacterized protein n=1 Tax=Undibacterium rivi TaxID=2828729 RepID=A0ABS5H5H2_9BURK|nr:hypothetical protein [Undibacterium rivi]MBR7793339.1 hypothetical protein [Undibacterium rivi]
MFLRGLLVCLLFSSTASAHVVMEALKATDQSQVSAWHYRVTSFENAKLKSVGVFDPAKEKKQQWLLESFEGRVPTEKETRKFLDKMESADQEKLSEQVDEKSLQAIDAGNNPRRWRFHMRKDADLRGVPPEKIAGIITLSEKGDLQRVEYSNIEAFRVKLILKMNHIVAVTEYEKQANGDNLVKSEAVETDVSVMGKDISLKLRTDYQMLRHQ